MTYWPARRDRDPEYPSQSIQITNRGEEWEQTSAGQSHSNLVADPGFTRGKCANRFFGQIFAQNCMKINALIGLQKICRLPYSHFTTNSNLHLILHEGGKAKKANSDQTHNANFFLISKKPIFVKNCPGTATLPSVSDDLATSRLASPGCVWSQGV